MSTWTRPADCDTNTCAEVMREQPGGPVYLRNSQDPLTIVTLSAAEWEALRADIAAGGMGNMAGL